MKKPQVGRLKDKYLSRLLTVILIFISFFAKGQTYNPTNFTISNKSYGVSQAVSTDARSWFYDGTNFVMRDFQNTAEVNGYLNLPKYRQGHFPIYIHSGGFLQINGVWLGGITQVWWYKDSVGNANLVRWYTDSVAGGTGTVTTVSGLSGSGYNWTVTNGTTTPQISLSLAFGGDISGPVNNISVDKFNGQLPSFYRNYLNLTNTPAIPAQINITDAGLFTHSGTYPNLTFLVTTPGIQATITANNALSGNSTINSGVFNWLFSGTASLGLPNGTTAQRPSSPTVGAFRYNTDSLNTETWNGSSWIMGGSGGGGGSGITALTGDGTASGTGSVPFTLATVNSNVFGSNTFLKFGVNGKGLVTSATAVIGSDITGALGFTPYNVTNPAGYIPLTALSALPPLLYNNTTGVFSADTLTGLTKLATQAFVNNQGFIKVDSALIPQSYLSQTLVGSAKFWRVDTSSSTGLSSYYLRIKDSIIRYVTPTQLATSIAASAGLQSLYIGPVAPPGYTNLTYLLNDSTLNNRPVKLLAPLFLTSKTDSTVDIGADTSTAITGLATLYELGLKQNIISGTGYSKWSGTTPSFLTPTQVTADLNIFSSTLKGLAPLSGGGTTNFLRADGTWAAPGGTGTVTNIATGLGLSGGPITSTGTLLLDTTYAMTKNTNQVASGNKLFSGLINFSTSPIFNALRTATAGTIVIHQTDSTFGQLGIGSGLSISGGNLTATGGGSGNNTATLDTVLRIGNSSSREAIVGSFRSNGSDTLGTTTAIVGDYLNDNFQRSSLGASYSTSLASATLTFPSSLKLHVTGGNNTFSNTISYTNSGQNFAPDKYQVNLKIVPQSNAANDGIGVAFVSAVTGNPASYYVKVDLGTANSASIVVSNTTSFTSPLISSIPLSFSITTDTLVLKVKRVANTFLYYLVNLTTGLSVNTSYTYNTTLSSNYEPNMATPTIEAFGGTQDVLLFEITDQTQLNGNCVFLATSIGEGYKVANINNRYPNRTFNGNTNLYDVNGGVSERASDGLTGRLAQAIAANPKYIIIEYGVNELYTSVSLATFRANVDTMVVRVIRAGIIPVMLSLVPQNTVSVLPSDSVLQVIQAARAGSIYVDETTPLIGTGTSINPLYGSGDGVHPNDAGQSLMGNILKNAVPGLFTGYTQNFAQFNRIPAASGTAFAVGLDSMGNAFKIPNLSSLPTDIAYTDTANVFSKLQTISNAGGVPNGLFINATSSSNFANLAFGNDQGGALVAGGAWIGLFGSAIGSPHNNNLYIRNNIPTGGIEFAVNSAERMFLDNTGRLGIGVTSSVLQHIHIVSSVIDDGILMNCTLASGYANYDLKNDQPDQAQLYLSGTTYTTNLTDARQEVLINPGTGGIGFQATNAAGGIKFSTGGTATGNRRETILANGHHIFNTTTDNFKWLNINGGIWSNKDSFIINNAATAMMLMQDTVTGIWGRQTVPLSLYTSDGTLSGNRTITQGNFSLTFSGGPVKFSGNTTGTPATLGDILNIAALTFTDNNTTTAGTVTDVALVGIGSPTFSASNSLITYTNASTFYINGAPGSGINTTLTNSYALRVGSGLSYFQGDVLLPHAIFKTSTPGISGGTGAGTSPTVSITGNDVDGDVTITTGTTPSATSTVATITFASSYAYPNHSYPTITAANAITAALNGLTMVYTTGATTNWTIISGTSGLTGATSYKWHFHVGGD